MSVICLIQVLPGLQAQELLQKEFAGSLAKLQEKRELGEMYSRVIKRGIHGGRVTN
ncbi:hypothetical protein QJS10_CPB17g01924 [Acorus calamus]|uniref:Uncharacterized protein n=1 Tax=Acorus calamus TaxID=4465 RepID=A0AAV9CV62_ACOCL|nr:hypothetical protein QJS10_CPB17g01924 [Acorus calamus]